MTEILAERTAKIDGDFVVFLIGMRIIKLWRVQKSLPVVRAMPKMLKDLEAAPAEFGFIGCTNVGTCMVQYWRSFDHLERYAQDRNAPHWP